MSFPDGDIRIFYNLPSASPNRTIHTMQTITTNLPPLHNPAPNDGVTGPASGTPDDSSIAGTGGGLGGRPDWAALVDALHQRWRASVVLAEQDQQLLMAAEAWHDAEPGAATEHCAAVLSRRLALRSQAEAGLRVLNQAVFQAQRALPPEILDQIPGNPELSALPTPVEP